jgi:hypothetical protein
MIHMGLVVLEQGVTIGGFIDQAFNSPALSATYKYAAYDFLGSVSGHKLREG